MIHSLSRHGFLQMPQHRHPYMSTSSFSKPGGPTLLAYITHKWRNSIRRRCIFPSHILWLERSFTTFTLTAFIPRIAPNSVMLLGYWYYRISTTYHTCDFYVLIVF